MFLITKIYNVIFSIILFSYANFTKKRMHYRHYDLKPRIFCRIIVSEIETIKEWIFEGMVSKELQTKDACRRGELFLTSLFDDAGPIKD